MILAILAAASTAPAAAPVAALITPATAADTSSPALVIEEEWEAKTDTSLSSTLSGWAQRAGWTLVWESDTDFRLSASAAIAGDFPAAAGQLLSAFSRTTPHLKAVFYRGNRVLRVWTERAEP